MKIPGKKHEQGQSLVEFALTLPVLLLILSGMLDLGRAYYTFIALEEAVAEAALYLAISPDCPYYDPGIVAYSLAKCEHPNNAWYRAVNSGNSEFDSDLAEWNLTYDSAAANSCVNTGGTFPGCWDSQFPQDCSSIGCNVIVQVKYPFEILTPGMQTFADQIILSTQASQIIVFEQQ